MESSSSLKTALAPMGSLVAVLTSPPGHAMRLAIFQVETGTLQMTLSSKEAAGASTKILFLSESLVAAVLTHQVIVWNLKRGVAEYTIALGDKSNDQLVEDDKNVTIVDAAVAVTTTDTSTDTPILYLLVSKHNKFYIYQYQHAGKLQRKIKTGKHKGLKLAVTANHLVVLQEHDQDGTTTTTTTTVRVLNATTGAKQSKCHLPSASLSTASLLLSANDSYAATIAAGQVILIELQSGKQIKLAGSVLVGEDCQDLVLHQDDQDKVFLWTQGMQEAKLYQLNMHGAIDQNKEEVPCNLALRVSCSGTANIDRSVLLMHGSKTIVAILQRLAQFQVIPTKWKEQKESKLVISWIDPDSKNNKTHASKRKNSSDQQPQKVLGASLAGGDARTISEVTGPDLKRSRTEASHDDDDNNNNMQQDADDEEEEDSGPTIAQRLEQLKQALAQEEDDDDDKEQQAVSSTNSPLFLPKQATTESLTQLLTQAIQSGDDAMLELAISVRDTHILQETCRQMPEELMPILLTALTSRLASKPSRSDDLVVWIRHVLKSGKVRSIEHLQPLRNMIQERIEVFPALLKLEGRLSMMGSI